MGDPGKISDGSMWSNLWVLDVKSLRTIVLADGSTCGNVTTIHPEGDMNICTQFNSNPYRDIQRQRITNGIELHILGTMEVCVRGKYQCLNKHSKADQCALWGCGLHTPSVKIYIAASFMMDFLWYDS